MKSSFLDDGQVESSNSEDDEVDHGASRAKRKREESSTEDEDISHNRFKKVEVNLKNHVYEPVHFVRAHCKAGEEPDVDTQVRSSLWYFSSAEFLTCIYHLICILCRCITVSYWLFYCIRSQITKNSRFGMPR